MITGSHGSSCLATLCLAVFAVGVAFAEPDPAEPTTPPSTDTAQPAPAPKGPEHPFQSIAVHNPFRLLPPPPPPDPEANIPPPPPPPPITVKLTGITDLLGGKKMAMLMLTEQGPNKQPKSVFLREGEGSDNVNVLAIDLKTKFVKIDNNGQVTNMTFAKIETPTAPIGLPPGAPGGGLPGGIPRLPGMPVNPGAPPNAIPGQPHNASAAPAQNDGGSVIIGGGDVDSTPRLGQRGGVFTSGAGISATSSGNGNTPVYNGSIGGGNSGQGIFSSSSPAGGGNVGTTPVRQNRGSPLFQIPQLPALPMPAALQNGQQK